MKGRNWLVIGVSAITVLLGLSAVANLLGFDVGYLSPFSPIGGFLGLLDVLGWIAVLVRWSVPE